MSYTRIEIPQENVEKQALICADIKSRGLWHSQPLALVDTYGCQQNEADSETIRGYLSEMGFGFTSDEDRAEVIVVNTCAVREHAEMRVLGNVGALTHTKRRNPDQLIIMCGCMVQQEHMAEKIKKSFPIVDMVFGPHELWRFPELFEELLQKKGRRSHRVFAAAPSDGVVAEGLPHVRDSGVKAWLSIMYGCNNFCTYCVVPYVRGRERSRYPEEILKEARELVQSGVRDITLLGQNVNSYGKDLKLGVDFADLIRMINDIPGDFRIRFMTSHPKDATEKLFLAMAECPKCAKQLHLPVQSGSNRILKAMNRVYTREQYLQTAARARELMPELVLTTDIIVGFPGETEEDFEDTLDLVRQVRYDSMFTFIYSKRQGTPAAVMPDAATREEKQARFDRLLEAANAISEETHAAYVGKKLRVLIDGETDGEYNLTSRSDGGRLVHLKGAPELIGSFAEAVITDSRTWALFGEIEN